MDAPRLRFAEDKIDDQPSMLQQLTSYGKNLIGTAAAAPSKTLENVASLTGGPKPYGKLGVFEEEYKNPEEIKPSSEAIKETFGVQEPKSLASRALHSTVENWPMLLFGGGSAVGKIGADLASSTGLHAAKDLGAGTIGQIGASILSAKGFGKAASALNKSFKNPSKIQEFTSHLYDKEYTLGSKIKASPDKIFEPLGNLYDNVENKFVNPSTFSEAAKNRSLENIKNASELINKPDLKASDVFEVKKLLNQVWAPKNSTEGKIYSELRNIFTKELDDIARAPKNKEWGETFKSADELYRISKWQSNLGRNIDQLTDSNKITKLISNPTMQGVMGILAGATLGTKAAAIPAALLGGKAAIKGAESIGRSSMFVNSLRKTNQGQKLLWDLVVDSAKDNTKGIASSLNKMNSMSQQWEKKHPDADANPRLRFAD